MCRAGGFGKVSWLKPGPCHMVSGILKPLESALCARISAEDLPFVQRYVSRQLCVTSASPAQCLCRSRGNLLVTGVALTVPAASRGKACAQKPTEVSFSLLSSGSRRDTQAGQRECWLFFHFLAGPIWIFLA